MRGLTEAASWTLPGFRRLHKRPGDKYRKTQWNAGTGQFR